MISETRLATVQWIKGNVIPEGVEIGLFDYVALAVEGTSTVVEIDFLENFNYKKDESKNIIFTDKGVKGWALLNIPAPSF